VDAPPRFSVVEAAQKKGTDDAEEPETSEVDGETNQGDARPGARGSKQARKDAAYPIQIVRLSKEEE